MIAIEREHKQHSNEMEYAQLGEVVFEVLSYQEHREENEFAWAKLQTIYAPSSLQFMGTELQKISMVVQWHREWCDPLEQYKKLKDLAKEGKPQKLIIASQVVGDFVIEKISSEIKQIDAWGKPVWIRVGIELLEYIPKTIEKKQRQTQTKKGKAVANKSKGAQKTQTQTQTQKQAQYQVVKKQNADGYTYTVIEEKK